MKCPEDWHPTCSCSIQALEPDQHCWVHGYPDIKKCPYCGQWRGYYTACKRCGCSFGISKKIPETIFTVSQCQPCEQHKDMVPQQRMFLSCGCSLADFGHYMIMWNGPGLGLVCDNKEDAERKAFMMNEAWNLAKGFTPDELVNARLENMI